MKRKNCGKVNGIHEIKENYKRFDDLKIERIAKNESRGLSDEVIPVLIAEIEKRELGADLIAWIKAERRKLTTSELREIKRKVESSICTNCGRRDGKLKGFEFRTITGILIDAIITDYRLIICNKCGKRKRRNSAIWTSILGWWSIIGLISTPFILIDKIKSAVKKDKESERIIENFIDLNVGKITLGENVEDTIEKLLLEFNGIEDEINLEEEN